MNSYVNDGTEWTRGVGAIAAKDGPGGAPAAAAKGVYPGVTVVRALGDIAATQLQIGSGIGQPPAVLRHAEVQPTTSVLRTAVAPPPVVLRTAAIAAPLAVLRTAADEQPLVLQTTVLKQCPSPKPRPRREGYKVVCDETRGTWSNVPITGWKPQPQGPGYKVLWDRATGKWLQVPTTRLREAMVAAAELTLAPPTLQVTQPALWAACEAEYGADAHHDTLEECVATKMALPTVPLVAPAPEKKFPTALVVGAAGAAVVLFLVLRRR